MELEALIGGLMVKLEALIGGLTVELEALIGGLIVEPEVLIGGLMVELEALIGGLTVGLEAPGGRVFLIPRDLPRPTAAAISTKLESNLWCYNIAGISKQVCII